MKISDEEAGSSEFAPKFVPRAATLLDVAQRAGVALATASYVLNNKPKSIGADARERVWRASRELGYRPNLAARALVTRQSKLIALWIPNVATAFSSRVIEEIQMQAYRDGYEVMICDTQTVQLDENETSPNTLLRLPGWNVDGVIAFFGSSSRVLELGPEVGATPIVSMGAYSIGGTDFVALDLASASHQAVEWMFEQGRKNVAFLVPHGADFSGDERREAYLEVLEQRGVAPKIIYMKENTRDAAFAAMNHHLSDLPHANSPKSAPLDALFCYNDYAAIGASRAARQVGLRVPEDVLVVGCDGIEDIQYLETRLHTIALPVPQMCAAAWKMLQQRIAQPQSPPQTKHFAGTFQISDS